MGPQDRQRILGYLMRERIVGERRQVGSANSLDDVFAQGRGFELSIACEVSLAAILDLVSRYSP